MWPLFAELSRRDRFADDNDACAFGGVCYCDGVRVVKLMSVISLMLAPLFKAEWPFQAPQWWAGAILLGVSLVALAIYWVVKMRLERNAADDIEMQQLLVGTPLLHH